MNRIFFVSKFISTYLQSFSIYLNSFSFSNLNRLILSYRIAPPIQIILELNPKSLSQSDLVVALEGIVGNTAVNDSEQARWTYALSEAWSTVSPGLTDGLYLDLGPPDVIVKPKTTDHVVEIVKLANQYKIPLIPRGGGTGNASGSAALASGGILLDLLDMNKFVRYDPVSRACRFQAGISWGKLLYDLKKLELIFNMNCI